MKPTSVQKRSLINSDEGVCTVHLSELEIEVLIQILGFAGNTAKFLASQGLKNDADNKEYITKMNQVADDSYQLARLIAHYVDIGEPKPDEIH